MIVDGVTFWFLIVVGLGCGWWLRGQLHDDERDDGFDIRDWPCSTDHSNVIPIRRRRVFDQDRSA